MSSVNQFAFLNGAHSSTSQQPKDSQTAFSQENIALLGQVLSSFLTTPSGDQQSQFAELLRSLAPIIPSSKNEGHSFIYLI
jgi:hypothetical protein